MSWQFVYIYSFDLAGEKIFGFNENHPLFPRLDTQGVGQPESLTRFDAQIDRHEYGQMCISSSVYI